MFDWLRHAYLDQLVSGPDGRRRLDRVSFAGHFDSMMFGRRGIARPRDEASLHPYRRRFVAQFARLRRNYGVRSFLADTMTVTPANVGEVARPVGRMGFGMLSFQPAAHVGDDRRRHGDYRDAVVSADAVWAQIDSRLRETQERLAACHYAMGHPEAGTLVPACVQHSVLDPEENAELTVLLPLPTVRRAAR